MIRSLTGLRFIFALMIFMHHFSIKEGQLMFPQGGALSVCFFFILSGFVLAYSYQERLVLRQISTKIFYTGRLSKLYPLHILCFLIALVLAIKVLSWKYVLIAPINLALLQSWIPVKDVYFSYNAVSWFSSVMLFFYMVFPWLAKKLFDMKWKTVGIWSICILSAYFLLIKLIPLTWQHALFYINPGLRLLDFILGIILYKGLNQLMIYNISPNKWIATFFEVITVAIVIVFVLYSNIIPDVYRVAIYYWLPLGFGLLVFSYFNNGGGNLTHFLSSDWLVRLGEISFSFYMIHQLIIRIYMFLVNNLHIESPWWIGFILVLSITVGCSFISFYYIEKPLSKWLKIKLFK